MVGLQGKGEFTMEYALHKAVPKDVQDEMASSQKVCVLVHGPCISDDECRTCNTQDFIC